jgi:predicted TIM-barrel fold metal-dependent hydrolase
MVIDFRVQPPYRSFLDLHFFRARPKDEDPVAGNPFALGRGPNPSFDARSLEVFRDELRQAGVTRAAIVGQRAAAQWGAADNEDLRDLLERYPDLFVGFAGVDPRDPDALEQLEAAVAVPGILGISLVAGWSDPPCRDDDQLLWPLYGACQDLGAAVVVTSSHFIGPDMSYAEPVHLAKVAAAFPRLRLIIGHACWPWTTQAVALAMRHTNVYLMPEFYLYLPDMPGARDYVDAVNGFLRHRILFSSCYPSRTVGEALEGIERLPLLPGAREALLHDNAARLLEELGA